MSRFTTKRDFWGIETYYDEDGNKIGTSEKTWLGEHVVKDDCGNTIGKVGTDSLGRKTITLDSFSIFTGHHFSSMLDSEEPEDCEYCENCGEWIGDDDCDCDI